MMVLAPNDGRPTIPGRKLNFEGGRVYLENDSEDNSFMSKVFSERFRVRKRDPENGWWV